MGKSRGFGIYLGLIVILILIVYFTRTISESNYEKYNYQAFEAALKNKQVSTATL